MICMICSGALWCICLWCDLFCMIIFYFIFVCMYHIFRSNEAYVSVLRIMLDNHENEVIFVVNLYHMLQSYNPNSAVNCRLWTVCGLSDSLLCGLSTYDMSAGRSSCGRPQVYQGWWGPRPWDRSVFQHDAQIAPHSISCPPPWPHCKTTCRTGFRTSHRPLLEHLQ